MAIRYNPPRNQVGGTLERTIGKFLDGTKRERTVPQPAWDNDRLLQGSATKHRTRFGVKYNKLIKLWIRTGKRI